MKPRSKKFSPEDRIALLKGCVETKLSVRQYALLKKVGYSTLTGWASQAGISLRNKKQKICSTTHQVKTSLADGFTPFNEDVSEYNNSEGFSFIDLTPQAKEATPPFLSGFIPHQVHQEPDCIKDPATCGLEIRMPNGVMLKVEQVPFNALWPQVIEFVRVLT